MTTKQRAELLQEALNALIAAETSIAAFNNPHIANTDWMHNSTQSSQKRAAVLIKARKAGIIPEPKCDTT